MKIRLSWKLFGVMMFNVVLIVGVMVVIMNLLVSREFQGYIRANDLERFQNVKEGLQQYYSFYGSWEVLASSRGRWGRILNRIMMLNDPYQQPTLHSQHRKRYLQQRFLNQDKIDRIRPNSSIVPPGPGQRKPPSQMVLQGQDFFMLRVVVFDEKGSVMLGRLQDQPPELMEDLFHENVLIGKIGLYPPEMMPHPRDELFLKTQKTIFWILAAVMTVMASLISLGLSWYLLKPVKQLTEGTRAVARREFDARLKIESRDELGQLAEDFNQMAETLESFEHQRRQWLSDVSHELGTPLSVLRGEIEAMQDGVRELSQERLNSLHDEVMQLTRIVEDLKLINRAEAGVLELREEDFSPTELLSRTASGFETRFDTHLIQVKQDFDGTIKTMIRGDSERLRQVYENLMENVIRHVQGPAVLTLKSRVEHSRLVLSLCDDGPGVDENMLPHLFDRFFRTDESRSRTSGGSGLGLAICKNLVEAQAGQIEAHANQPRGLCIRISLPLVRKDQA
ncbi:MAG: ATP-binding protein [bacterium]